MLNGNLAFNISKNAVFYPFNSNKVTFRFPLFTFHDRKIYVSLPKAKVSGGKRRSFGWRKLSFCKVKHISFATERCFVVFKRFRNSQIANEIQKVRQDVVSRPWRTNLPLNKFRAFLRVKIFVAVEPDFNNSHSIFHAFCLA